jgi:hypothetical protein
MEIFSRDGNERWLYFVQKLKLSKNGKLAIYYLMSFKQCSSLISSCLNFSFSKNLQTLFFIAFPFANWFHFSIIFVLKVRYYRYFMSYKYKYFTRVGVVYFITGVLSYFILPFCQKLEIVQFLGFQFYILSSFYLK